MSDDEWAAWAAQWNEKDKEMPKVILRAKSDRMRAMVGVAIFAAIAMWVVVSSGRGLVHAHSVIALVGSGFVIMMMVSLGVAIFLAMRGTWRASGSEPLELLAALERRHLARRVLMRATNALAAVIVMGMLALTLAESLVHFELGGLLSSCGVCAFTVVLVWLVTRNVGRTIDRELREVAETRAMLHAGDDSVS